jgi:hypothetical protein
MGKGAASVAVVFGLMSSVCCAELLPFCSFDSAERVAGKGRLHIRPPRASDPTRDATQLDLEGVVGARASSTYVCRRCKDWLKIKAPAG